MDGRDAALEAGGAGGTVTTGCSPCNSIHGALVACGVPSSSCVSQTSQMTNADGTTTTQTNTCFTSGLEELVTKTTGGADGGVSTTVTTTQRIANGTTCYKEVATETASATGQQVTEVFMDASGALVATLQFNVVVADGGAQLTQTITCAGQAPEPYQFCLPASFDAGAQGSPGGVICTAGSCM